MAYQIGRGKRFSDTLELLGDDGQVALSINVDLDLDKIAQDFNTKRNRIIQAEQNLKKAQKENIQDVERCMEIYGEAIISIMALIFGAEDARRILEYYEGRYIEMAQQVFPYLIDVIVPAIKEMQQQQVRVARDNYKASQRRRFGRY